MFLPYTTMQHGTITELVDRGFGFIRRVGIKEHLYFHSDDLVGLVFGKLTKGDKVTFNVVQSKKGPYATRVSEPN